jgi:MFS transporter, Spinster family, sphingosine-1-phosphate transporter
MFAYWGPSATTFMFSMHNGHADILFGGVTVLTGITGTLAGGLVLDALGGSETGAAAVCLASCALGFVLLQAAFRLCFTLTSFIVVFACGQFALFMLQAPITRIVLLAVSPDLQPLAFSIQTIAIHVLGDVPSPPLAGLVHDGLFSPDDVVCFILA